jgi:hypothetical protein
VHLRPRRAVWRAACPTDTIAAVKPTVLLAALAALAGCGGSNSSSRSTSATPRAAMPNEAGFRELPASAWRGYRSDSLPASWQVVDGALTRVGRGGDIVTREMFANFELRLDWNVSPGGNSGIMYRVMDGLEATYRSGPEMQVLDDSGHVDGRSRLTSAGSLYGLVAAPAGVVRPPGQWNEVRIVANGAHVEHWLNGTKVVEIELWSDEWRRLVRASKFNDWPEFGMAREGRIALQDHGDRVAFRNIRIRSF